MLNLNQTKKMFTDTLNSLLVSLKAALPLLFELSKDTSTYHRDQVEDAEEDLNEAKAELEAAEAEVKAKAKVKADYDAVKAEIAATEDEIKRLDESVSFAHSLEISKKLNDELIAAQAKLKDAETRYRDIDNVYNTYDIEHATHKLDAAKSAVKRYKGRVARERRRYDSKEDQITAKNKIIDEVIKNFS